MFLENKYTRWYLTIIENARSKNRYRGDGEYYESHHVIPRSLGGTEVVLLTAKEHYMCHLMLPKMLEGSNKYKMVNALIRMAFSKSSGQKRHTAKSYSLVRKMIAEKNSATLKGVPKSEEARRNMKGRSGTWKRTSEYCKSMSEARKGTRIGCDNPFFGRKHDKDVMQRRSQRWKDRGYSPAAKMNSMPNVTCPHCNKTGNNGAMRRWHFDNCKENKVGTPLKK
jgi:hypothetical protein